MSHDHIPVSTLLNGDEKITVTFRDGKSAEVTVPLVPIRNAMKYLGFMDDPAVFVGFILGKDEKWVDGLTDDSLFEVDALARKANDPRIARCVDRQTAAVATLLPLAKQAQALQRSVPTG